MQSLETLALRSVVEQVVAQDPSAAAELLKAALDKQRATLASRFEAKHANWGFSKAQRAKLLKAWSAVSMEMDAFVEADDADHKAVYHDPDTGKWFCEPDLSGRLVQNRHGWKVKGHPGLEELALPGTRVFFEHRVDTDKDSVHGAMGELSRAAFCQRNQGDAPFVLVAVFPHEPDLETRTFFTHSGINVHVCPHMTGRRRRAA